MAARTSSSLLQTRWRITGRPARASSDRLEGSSSVTSVREREAATGTDALADGACACLPPACSASSARPRMAARSLQKVGTPWSWKAWATQSWLTLTAMGTPVSRAKRLAWPAKSAKS